MKRVERRHDRRAVGLHEATSSLFLFNYPADSKNPVVGEAGLSGYLLA
jgi:hypothetical protein